MKINREQIIALALTLLLALLSAVVLVCVKVMPAQWSQPEPQTEEQEIFFADIEYEEIKTDPTPTVDGNPASAPSAEQGGLDLTDAGKAEEPVMKMITTPKPSTAAVQTTEQPAKDPGPTQEELDAKKSAAINSQLGNAFAKNNKSDAGTGKAQSGNASTGANTASDGLGLDGRRRLGGNNPDIHNVTGKVRVRIRVNSAGKVTKADVVSSSGFGSREAEVRTACVNASMTLVYNADSSKPTQEGIITWNIK